MPTGPAQAGYRRVRSQGGHDAGRSGAQKRYVGFFVFRLASRRRAAPRAEIFVEIPARKDQQQSLPGRRGLPALRTEKKGGLKRPVVFRTGRTRGRTALWAHRSRHPLGWSGASGQWKRHRAIVGSPRRIGQEPRGAASVYERNESPWGNSSVSGEAGRIRRHTTRKAWTRR